MSYNVKDNPPYTPAPEFVKIDVAARMFSLSRPTIYNLIGDGLIKSVNLRRPGMQRGTRLIHVESMRGYLHSLPS